MNFASVSLDSLGVMVMNFLPEFANNGLDWASSILKTAIISLSGLMTGPFAALGPLIVIIGDVFAKSAFSSLKQGVEIYALKSQVEGTYENLVKFLLDPCIQERVRIVYQDEEKQSEKKENDGNSWF